MSNIKTHYRLVISDRPLTPKTTAYERRERVKIDVDLAIRKHLSVNPENIKLVFDNMAQATQLKVDILREVPFAQAIYKMEVCPVPVYTLPETEAEAYDIFSMVDHGLNDLKHPMMRADLDE